MKKSIIVSLLLGVLGLSGIILAGGNDVKESITSSSGLTDDQLEDTVESSESSIPEEDSR